MYPGIGIKHPPPLPKEQGGSPKTKVVKPESDVPNEYRRVYDNPRVRQDNSSPIALNEVGKRGWGDEPFPI